MAGVARDRHPGHEGDLTFSLVTFRTFRLLQRPGTKIENALQEAIDFSHHTSSPVTLVDINGRNYRCDWKRNPSPDGLIEEDRQLAQREEYNESVQIRASAREYGEAKQPSRGGA